MLAAPRDRHRRAERDHVRGAPVGERLAGRRGGRRRGWTAPGPSRRGRARRSASATPATCSFTSCGCDQANGVTRQIAEAHRGDLVPPAKAPVRTAARASRWRTAARAPSSRSASAAGSSPGRLSTLTLAAAAQRREQLSRRRSVAGDLDDRTACAVWRTIAAPPSARKLGAGSSARQVGERRVVALASARPSCRGSRMRSMGIVQVSRLERLAGEPRRGSTRRSGVSRRSRASRRGDSADVLLEHLEPDAGARRGCAPGRGPRA